ncbi:hypothetical protein JCM6882_001252 [Rhodosporidiobolus microsporus]
MIQPPDQRSIAERRGRQQPLYPSGDRERASSPPPATRTVAAFPPPYALTPNDCVDLGHHPGKPAPADNEEVTSLQNHLAEYLRIARKAAKENPVAQSITLAIQFIEAQDKINVRLYNAQKDELSDMSKTSRSLLKHTDTNMRVCRAALDFRQDCLGRFRHALESYRAEHDPSTFSLEHFQVKAIAEKFEAPVPLDKPIRPWPKNLKDRKTSWRYKNRYTGRDLWLEQGREQYGHEDKRRPETP